MRARILIVAALLVAVAVSCGRKLPEPSIGWPAQRAIDALVGEYVADTLIWDGSEVNLAEFVKRLAEQSFTVSVDSNDISRDECYFSFPVICSVRYSQYPQEGYITVHFKADKDGTLSFETKDTFIQDGCLEEPEVSFVNGRLSLSYLTEVLVRPGQFIEGRMTSIWRCKSTKEREQ